MASPLSSVPFIFPKSTKSESGCAANLQRRRRPVKYALFAALVVILSCCVASRNAHRPDLLFIGMYKGDFDEAVSSICSTRCSLQIDQLAIASSDVIVPSTLGVRILEGGSIHYAAKDIKFNGPFEAHKANVFTGTGEVSFGHEAVDKVLPPVSYTHLRAHET